MSYVLTVSAFQITEESFVSASSMHFESCICPFMKDWLAVSESQDFDWENFILPTHNKSGEVCALVVSKDQLSPSDISNFYDENLDLLDAMCGDIRPLRNEPGLRFFDPLTSNTLQASKYGVLNGYGCFCSAGNAWKIGRGQPVDEIDDFCMQVTSAYRCLREKDSPACDIPRQIYLSLDTTIFDVLYTTGNVDNMCQALQNVIPVFLRGPEFDLACATRKCAIESKINAFLFTRATTPGVTIPETFVRQDQQWVDEYGNIRYGNFDFEGNCFGYLGSSDWECCGLYPDRFSYRTGDLMCCSDHTVGTSC